LRTSAGLGLLLLLCLVTPFGRVNADPLFAMHKDYPAAGQPSSVAIGDVDGDGNPDLVVGGNVLSVLFGDGNGMFPTQVDFQPWTYVSSVALGDLNGDGNLDVVATNYNAISLGVSVWLGNRNRMIPQRADYVTGARATSVAIGDLDGDSNPDLAVANSASNTVTVLFGNSHGIFGSRIDPVTGTGPLSVAIGDFNGDNIPDLAVANSGSNKVSVLLGKGGRAFKERVDYDTGVSPKWVAIGYLDGDGNPDLAVANSGSNTVSVLLGLPNGTFVANGAYGTYSAPACVAIGDLDGDGKADLATANTTQPTSFVSVLLGNGNGTFATKMDYPSGAGPDCVAIGDLNHDGKRDLAVADANVGKVSVLLNISPTTAVPPAAPPARFALMLAGPNPARSAVSLAAALPQAATVEVAIYSVQGGLVRRLLAGASLPAGIHPLVWDGRDESGARAPRGVFFARMRADGIVSGRTTILLR
jgi:VCBS repeat protein/flagellar hook capping protein FlgD